MTTNDSGSSGWSRVLVYQPGSIGDTVVCIPALRAVRRHAGPTALITLLHEKRPHLPTTPVDVLSGSGLVDEFVAYPYPRGRLARLGAMVGLVRELRRRRFDAVVYLAPSERTAGQVRRDAAFFGLAGCGRRVGFSTFTNEELYPVDGEGRPGRVPHEGLFKLTRLERDGIDVTVERELRTPMIVLPPQTHAAVTSWLARSRAHPDRPLVAICPGAKQPTNLWPVDRFTEIGRRLAALQRYELVVVGGPAEKGVGAAMIEAWGQGLNAAGSFAVLESAAILARCAFVVGLDTGTTHLAAASGVPCVALYGERDHPGRWEPFGAGHVILRNAVACAGCRVIEVACTVPDHPCMTGLAVETVWDGVRRLIEREERAQS